MNDRVEVDAQSAPSSISRTLNGVRLSQRIMPSRRALRGGDWCEAFAVTEDTLAFSIVDVCGHGETKHAAMTVTSAVIREAAGQGLDPAQTLAEAHRCLRLFDPDEYATALFALYSIPSRTLVFANAGHPPPLLASPLATLYLEFPNSDLPLGIEAQYVPVVRRVKIPAESLLVFYTDGVIERERKPLQGAAELHDAAIFATRFSSLPSAAIIAKQMFLTGSNVDDATILAAWTPKAPEPIRRVTKFFGRPH